MKNALDNKMHVGVIITDLSKAFDCLPHNLMVEKFRRYRFSERAAALLGNYLDNRFQRVKILGDTSSWAPIVKGVPQGSNIGPHCFNVYLNDLLLLLEEKGVTPSNYADDNSLSVIGKNKEEVIGKLEEIIELLLRWFVDNQMKANTGKFQLMLLSPNVRERSNCSVRINNLIIENQAECKVLGVNIDEGLSYAMHIDSICAKANAKLSALKRLSRFLTTDCKLSLLRSFIVCHFLYCAVLLHFAPKKSKDKMEKIVYRGLKMVFSDYNGDYEELLKRANMDSLELQRQKSIVVEMYKCLQGIGPKYLSDIFKFRRNGRRGPISNELRANTAKYGTHSLRVYGPKLWNKLDKDLRESVSLPAFKKKLQDFKGIKCNCALCR